MEPLGPWPDEPTDPSLREVEEELPTSAPPLLQRNSSYVAPRPGSGQITAISSSPMSGSSPAMGSAVAANKPKFKDLDAFLDESSEEESSDEEKPEGVAPAAPTARAAPSTFVPEYREDEATESEEDTSEEEEEDAELMQRSRR